MNRKKLITLIQYIVLIGVCATLVWWQFHGMQPDEKASFIKSLKEANYWIVVPVIGMAIISYWARGQRWRIMIEPLGYRAKMSNAFACTMIGYLVNSFVPRLGEVIKCTILGRYEKIAVDKLIGTVVVERIFDLLCYAVLIGVTVATQLKNVKRFVAEHLEKTGTSFDWTKTWVISAVVIVLVFCLGWLLKRAKNNKLVAKVKHVLANLKEGITSINHLKHKGAFIGYTLLIWAMYLLEIYIGFQAMEATAGLGFGTACAALTLASLAMILLPGGAGLFPVFIANVLLMYHINFQNGYAFGWLMWGVSTSLNLILGFICLLIIPSLNKNYHPVETSLSYPE
jgi:uncharacterized protein (TIRG00374 family)